MGCCHYYAPTVGGDTAFSVDVSAITFGPGVLAEAGDHIRARGIKRVALMTDKVMAGLEHLASVRASLEAAGLDVVLYDEVRVEPTDKSFLAATEFARACGADAKDGEVLRVFSPDSGALVPTIDGGHYVDLSMSMKRRKRRLWDDDEKHRIVAQTRVAIIVRLRSGPPAKDGEVLRN